MEEAFRINHGQPVVVFIEPAISVGIINVAKISERELQKVTEIV